MSIKEYIWEIVGGFCVFATIIAAVWILHSF